MFCKKCGSEVEQGSNFCNVCGVKVSGETGGPDQEANISGQGTPAALDHAPEGEVDLWEAGRSGKKYFFHYLLAIVVIIAAVVAIIYWPEEAIKESPVVPDNETVEKVVNYFKYLPFACAVTFFLIIYFKAFVYTHSLTYRVTTERLFTKTGFLSKHLDELDLIRVNDVTVSQKFIERLLGIGNVTVISNDETTPTLLMKGIDDPVAVKEHIRAAAAKRRKSGLFVERI